MELTLADILLKLASLLPSLTTKLAGRKKARRERVASLLDSVSQCLGGMARTLREGRTPHDSCMKLETYFNELEGLLKHSGLEAEKAEELFSALTDARAGPLTALQLIGYNPEAVVHALDSEHLAPFQYGSPLRGLRPLLMAWPRLPEAEREAGILDVLRRTHPHDPPVSASGPKAQEVRSLIEAWNARLDAECRKIEEAAGLFKGTANVLKASG